MFGNLVGARSSDRSISSGYGCVSVALVLGILELSQIFIVLLCKISLSGVVEKNTIPQVILKIPQSINDGVDWANYSLRTGALEHHFRGPRASS